MRYSRPGVPGRGTEFSEVGMAVCSFSEGVYVTGFSEGNLVGNMGNGKSDLFLSAFTSDGEKIFTIQKGSAAAEWETSGNDEGNAVTADPSGFT